jgi:Tim17/Tim22/Tim23/Pmp24 family
MGHSKSIPFETIVMTRRTTTMSSCRCPMTMSVGGSFHNVLRSSVVVLLLAVMMIGSSSPSTSTWQSSRRSISFVVVDASAVVYSPRHHSSSSSSLSTRRKTKHLSLFDDRDVGQGRRRRRQCSTFAHGYDDGDGDSLCEEDDDYDYITTRPSAWLASTKRRSGRNNNNPTYKYDERSIGLADADNNDDEIVEFRDLGPIGKTVAGVTEIVVATFFEYLQGFMTGWIFGTVVGTPGFLVKPINPSIPLRQTKFIPEFKGRFSRMNTRSVKWAKDWASISAAFGGFGVAVRVLRNGKEDVWNEILSSAAAGAFFARKDGLDAMIRGALLYGGLIYFVSGGFSSKRRLLQDYTERPLTSSSTSSSNQTEALQQNNIKTELLCTTRTFHQLENTPLSNASSTTTSTLVYKYIHV